MLALAFLFSLATAASGPASPPFQETRASAEQPSQTGAAEPQPAAEPALSPEAHAALERLRSTLREQGPESARELLAETVADLTDPESGAELEHIAFLCALYELALELGCVEESQLLCEPILALRSRVLPPEHHLLKSKVDLAGTRRELGDLAGALALLEEVCAAWTRLLPPEHPDFLKAKLNLATTRRELGNLAGALALDEEVHAAYTRLLPPEHPDLLKAKMNLATTRAGLGDFAGALVLEEEVHVARTRLLPPEHSDLLKAKLNLATTRAGLGDFAGALALEEEVHATWTRRLPPQHPDLLRAKRNLATTRAALGDLAGALALDEEVHAAWTRLLPPEHPDVLKAKLNLASTRADLGDPAGALALEEEVYAAWKLLLPPEHPNLLKVKANLALARSNLGDLSGALALLEEVHKTWSRFLPREHPDLLKAKGNLAMARRSLGDLPGALALLEEVHETWSRILPREHPDLLKAKGNLATTRAALGDLAGALALGEEAHAAWTRLLPPEHPDLLTAKMTLAWMRRVLGDLAGAHALASDLLSGMRLRARALRTEAARPAREGARAELARLSTAIFLSSSGDPKYSLDPELFATLETLRLASVASSENTHALADRPELAEGTRDLSLLRSRLSGLVAAAPAEEAALESWRKELLALAQERDRAQRKLLLKLAETGEFLGEIDAELISGKLEAGTAAVSYFRYTKGFDKDKSTGERPPAVESLLAFLVQPGGGVRRFELGPAAEVEELVRGWRSSLGKPLERDVSVAVVEGLMRGERGLTIELNESPTGEDAGRDLRARILDPLLAACGEDLRALHVVLDDVLFLVPLDALPLEKEERLGERVRIHVEPTLGRLLWEERAVPPESTLVALGGIDFDTEKEPTASSYEGDGDENAPPSIPHPLVGFALPPTERAGRSGQFAPLRQTLDEVVNVGKQYKEAFEREPLLLQGDAASKAALHVAAPKARFLHLATHGWFASEIFKSQLDTRAASGSAEPWQKARETLTGFAPETLCGLALAGANKGRDELGRVPGILTAEELASFDLRGSELAVLSACETNAGTRRAGQGIQSLQTALHAAGARTAITSLWKVDDAVTRRLFELFYAKLWKEKLGKYEALWQAKMALRAEGHPPRAWAAWVLTGAPD